MNNINIISNLNTIDVQKENKISQCFFYLQNSLNNNNMNLNLINQDKNYVFIQITNRINNKKSSIIDILIKDLLNIDKFFIKNLIKEVFNNEIYKI